MSILSQKKKKCKNGIECYLDAIKTMEDDNDFIKAKMGNAGSSVTKLVSQVKEEIHEYAKEHSDHKISELL
jgi:hypothetical protein